MNADTERTPRDAHLDHHRRSTLSRRRHRVGRTRRTGVTTRIHINRAEPGDAARRLGEHSRTAARCAARRGGRRLRGGAGVAPPPPGRARAARRPGLVHAGEEGGAARRARCERAARLRRHGARHRHGVSPRLRTAVRHRARSPLPRTALRARARGGGRAGENLTVAALALGHAGGSASGSRWPSTSAVGRRALSGRVRVRDHFDAPLEAGRAGDPGRVRACGAARKGARPAGAQAGAACDTGGPNGRCRRSDAKRRPCGRPREVRTEPGARSAGPPAYGAEMVPPCDPRGPPRRFAAGADVRRGLLGRRGLGGDPARLPPVTTRPAKGGEIRKAGSDRRPKRPPGQWRQGDC